MADIRTDIGLVESAREWVLNNLPYDRSDTSLSTYLHGLDAHGLLIAYHNWMSRLIKPQPRTVLTSAALCRNPLTSQRSADLSKITGEIEQGSDLTRYLSRGVQRHPVKRAGSKARPDLDLMLNDWGIHHLHISTQLESDGFVRRDGPLLFAVFRPTKAYLIDIMGHGADWTSEHVVRVIASEWPGAEIVREIRGEAANLSFQPMESERKALRDKHVNATFEHEGRVYMPAGGLTSAGTTLAATRDADRLVDALTTFEQKLEAEPEWLRSEFEANGVTYPATPQFEFAIREDGVGIIETETSTWMLLNGLMIG